MRRSGRGPSRVRQQNRDHLLGWVVAPYGSEPTVFGESGGSHHSVGRRVEPLIIGRRYPCRPSRSPNAFGDSADDVVGGGVYGRKCRRQHARYCR